MKLTANFDSAEFACKCGCGFEAVNPELVAALQQLRDALEKPVFILSGRRCASHNAKVGGAKQSQHVLGNAADIQVSGMTVRQLYKRVAGIPSLRGIGVSDQGGFVHVDVRPKPAKWCYENGRECRWFDV